MTNKTVSSSEALCSHWRVLADLYIPHRLELVPAMTIMTLFWHVAYLLPTIHLQEQALMPSRCLAKNLLTTIMAHSGGRFDLHGAAMGLAGWEQVLWAHGRQANASNLTSDLRDRSGGESEKTVNANDRCVKI